MPNKYRVTPQCEVVFTRELVGDFKGSISLVEVVSGNRHTLYFTPQGVYFADTPEHSPHDRPAFEEGLRQAAVEYCHTEISQEIQIKPLRINYPAAARRIMASYPKNT